MSVVLSEQKDDEATFQSLGRSDAGLVASVKSSDHGSFTSFGNNSSVTYSTTQTSATASSTSTMSRRRTVSGRSGTLKSDSNTRFASKLNPLPPLDFDSAGLVGRDTEVSVLKNCYNRLTTDGTKELIIVAGQSGSGKSSAVRSIENEISVEGLFVEGKFDMHTSHEPYSGVAKAFGAICTKVNENGSETVEDLRQELSKELGGKPGVLVQMIPELEAILGVDGSDSTMESIDRVNESEGGVERLRFAFRVLTRVFSSFFSPLILFLDDLQWSDVSSLQVLDYLISDAQNENPLMIIGSYRSEDVDENSLLYNKLLALREKTYKFHFNITEICVEAFLPNDIEKVITSVLPSLRADHIVGLAALCHKRTLGNPFFTIEFLRMLHFEGMLKFDITTKTWSWDLLEIEEETMSTANVVAMLEQHLRKLPGQVQALLQCAAYLGSTFRLPTLDLVWSVYGRRLVESKVEPLSSLLPRIIGDRIFEKADSKQCRWCHDKLQEAALCLSGALRETFQLDIGKTLYYGLSKEQVEADLFTIVDLINCGNVTKQADFVAANLRAAEKAREISAFQSAAEYANEGICLLQERDWKENMPTALKLYTIGSEAELLIGNVDKAARYRKFVLSHSTRLTTIAILPLQVGEVKALGDVELKHKQAQEYCFKLLKKHGDRLTWVRSLALPQAITKFMLLWKKAKAKPPGFFDNLEPFDDTKKKYIGYLLSKGAEFSYHAGDTAMYLLATVKMVELTLEYGINQLSATAMSFFALMGVLVLQDYEGAERFQNVAFGMLKKFRGMQNAEAIYTGLVGVLFWIKPIEIGRTMIKEAILAGGRQGDLAFTSWSIALEVVYLPFVTGRPIHTILEKCPSTLAEFEEIKTTVHVLVIKSYYQMFLNLQDSSCSNPSKHTGTVYSDAKDDHKGNSVVLSDIVVAEGELVFWHEDYETIAKHALQVGETYAKLAPGLFLHQIESFHRAVALYAAAIQTKKRKYRRAANKIWKNLMKLTQYGNTTVHYYCMFLSAEKLSLEKKATEAKIKYEQALQAVGKLGHLHHLGLVHERYSDFLLRDLSLEKEAKHHLEEAIRYYKEWGSVHKVKALESRV